MNIPKSFVEYYTRLREFSDTAYQNLHPKAIHSTISWDCDESFKHFAGKNNELGSLLIGGQHGGSEGFEENSMYQSFERNLVDVYLT